MEVTLINRDTASILLPQTIVEQTDDGFIVNNHNCWKLIPVKRVESVYEDSEYYKTDPIPEKQEKKNNNPFLAYSEEVNQQYTEKMEYRFGFQDLVISTKQTAKASGIISNPISISYDTDIAIELNIENQQAGSIEVSILDNTDEVPILYNHDCNIIKEQLFYGVPTRFVPDNHRDIILYEDNIPVSKDYILLSVHDFQEHTYTISYTAIDDRLTYCPISDKIRIKIIMRQYDADTFIKINHCVIHKSKETLTWNSNQ